MEQEAYLNLRSYLVDPTEEIVDEDGNTSIHVSNHVENLEELGQMLKNNPQLLFMLNKEGLSSLDVAVKEQDNARAQFLIERYQQFGPSSCLRFVKRPNKLDLKFEKAFTLALTLNNYEMVKKFPTKHIKTVHVLNTQLRDFDKYKADKEQFKDILTTPFHYACKVGNDWAIRILVESNNFDCNILINKRSPLFELVNTPTHQDAQVISYLMKKCRPCVNSGDRLPLNQALLRGHPFISRVIIEYGEPSPTKLDNNGKNPIHVAAAKLDLESFSLL